MLFVNLYWIVCMLKAHPPINDFQAQNIVDTCFAAASYATRDTIHSTLRISPGALVFLCDMILNFSFITDLQLIHHRRQVIIDEKPRQANFHRRPYDNKVCNEIIILLDNPTTLDDCSAILTLFFKCIPMAQSIFNELCISLNKLKFVTAIKPFHR